MQNSQDLSSTSPLYFHTYTMTMMYWRCGCGKVELEISGEPWSVGNCHCHSCVASSRFLDEKYQGEKRIIYQALQIRDQLVHSSIQMMLRY